LNADQFQRCIEQFNRDDQERGAAYIPNRSAWAWLREKIPHGAAILEGGLDGRSRPGRQGREVQRSALRYTIAGDYEANMESLEYLALVLALVIIGFVILIAATFMRRQRIPDGLEINGLRIVKDGFVSVCLLPLAGGEAALFDAGNDKTGKAILRELARLGLGPENVTTIFLTHGHRDHVAGAPLFPGARVMALSEEVDVVEGRASSGGPILRMLPVRPTGMTVNRALRDGEVVDLGTAKVRVFAVPGHTAGSAAYLVNRVLMLGDAADVGSDGRLKSPPWLFSKDRAQDRASLKRLAMRLANEGGVEALVCAHSGALKQGLEPLALAARGW
jgi:glyoxylase-like metal-dependent hydrolase (beta-lactamase superfamily II)